MTDDAYAAYTADDAILLNLVRTGEAEAYEVLRQRHEQAARRLARCLVPPEEVDDLVAETFARVLNTTLRGDGPTDAFRPYLLTALRRVSYESLPGQHDEVPADFGETPDPGELLIDPGMAELATSLIVRAFRSLPDRWIAVLWHTVIEETSPPEITQILGLSLNEVAALKRRARTGLRKAYLQLLISDVARPECQPVARRLADIVRDTASSQDRAMVTEHLGQCRECRAAYTDLTDLNIALRSQAGRVFLGGAAGSYLPRVQDSAASTAAAEPASEQTGQEAAALGAGERARRSRHISRPLLLTAAGTVPLAAIAAALAVTLTGQGSPPIMRSGQPLQAAAQPTTEPSAHKPQAKGATAIPSTASRPTRSPGAPRAASSPSAHPPGQGPHPSSPAPSATPAPGPTSASPASLTMAASLNTGQTETDQLSFGITNSGGTTTGDVSLSVSLPAGTSLWSGPGAVSSGWSCQSTSFGMTCQTGPIAANTQVHADIVIGVWDLGEACGARAYLNALSGSVSTGALTGDGVQCRWG